MRVMGLADLPIDVAEAMYSPDFVELATLTAAGLPMALPMSFTLDVPGNRVRFSSPLTAARLGHLARDPRCAVSFSRVTAGHPPVLLQGIATLGEVAEGVRRGPARRFTVAPARVLLLDDPPQAWRFDTVEPVTPGGADAKATGMQKATERRAVSGSAVTEADLAALAGFDTAIVALCDRDGWPLSLPVEPRREGGGFLVCLPALDGAEPVAGPASLVGHTWTKDGPRFLAFTGRAALDGATLQFTPGRALRRG